MNQYLRIVHRGRGFNIRVELPDHTTQLVPVAELEQWERMVLVWIILMRVLVWL